MNFDQLECTVAESECHSLGLSIFLTTISPRHNNILILDSTTYHSPYFHLITQGRARYFFVSANPLNILAADEELERAREIVDAYRNGTEDKSLTDCDIWDAKELYDSAYHPQTGEKLFLPGRISAQVPGNCFITGMMMTFYKSTSSVIFWQWANQTFNALVNYTNRNTSVEMSNEQLAFAYTAATGAAMATAIALNKVVASSPTLSSGIVGRLVPLVAVSAANCANIPLMRQRETVDGIGIETPDGKPAGASTAAAYSALGQVIPSRVAMAVPGSVSFGPVLQSFSCLPFLSFPFLLFSFSFPSPSLPFPSFPFLSFFL
jgi:tricarboxylate carrier